MSHFKQVAAIVAIDSNNGFAKNGTIPWHFPDDFRWFKKITDNSVCLMGRSTYDHVNALIGPKGKEAVLPNRKTFVLSRSKLVLPNATIVNGIIEFFDIVYKIKDYDNLFILGGQEIFNLTLPECDTVYITRVNRSFNCDRVFPVRVVENYYDLKYSNVRDDLTFQIYTTKQSQIDINKVTAGIWDKQSEII